VSNSDLPDHIDPSARDRVTVTGPDAMTYLQSQIAQEIRQQAVGDSQWTLVLEPTGKIEALARIARTGDESFVLDTDAGFGAALEKRLERFKIRVKAELELEPAVHGEPSAAHEAARINAGWPRMGAEIVPGETIPAVTGIVGVSVNFTKGCYPGQELVERMDSRGAEAPKSLRIVEITEGTAVGDPILDADGNAVGTITSVSGTTALGYVKRGCDLGRVPEHGA
jgi:folate-binding protein YgfZ